jgi:hypothetical protein
MKHFVWILVLTCGICGTVPAEQAKRQASKAKAKAEALTLPAGAEKLEDGVWRSRDAQGRTWIYKKTPFGLIRMEEQGTAAPAPAAVVRVVEARGEEAVFERQTPFGRKTWTKRLGELDEEERRAMEEWKKAKR